MSEKTGKVSEKPLEFTFRYGPDGDIDALIDGLMKALGVEELEQLKEEPQNTST